MIFKDAFAAADLPYFKPTSPGKHCKPADEYEARSQNLGHTTFSSYGDVAGHRQAEIIAWPSAPANS
jgi:hypothetical protein